MLTGCLHGHVCWRQQLDKALLKRKNNNGTVKTVCFVPLRKTKFWKILYCNFFAHFSFRSPHYCIWTLQEQVSKIRQRSHLVPGHGARVRYSLGTNVNTPFFQVPTLELGHGAGARPQGLHLVVRHKSGHWVPVCTQFLLVLRQSTALFSLL